MTEARIKLRVDGAGSAKADIKSVADTFDSLGESAKGVLGGIAAGLSAGAFASWIKGAIDAADSLNDLSKSTSVSVEQLAGLDLAARQSGGNLDSIAQSINKLSVNIGKDAEKFAKIGITAKEPLEAFKQLADVYNSIQDPQQKAAFGAEALGKSWQGAAPLLAEGGKAIGEMVEKGTKLSGMTKDFADQSDKFNDGLAEMSTALSGVAARLGSDLLPLFNEVTKGIAGTSQEAADAAVSFNPITEAFRALIVVGGNIAFVFKSVGVELGGVAAQIGALASGEWQQAVSIGEAMKVDAAKARETFDQWEANIMNVGKVAKQTAKEIAELPLTQPGQDGKVKPGAVAGFIGGNDSGKAEAERATKARASFIASLEKEYQTLGKTAEQNKLYEASLLGIKGRQLELVKAKLADIEVQKSLIKEVERWDGVAKDMADEQKKQLSAMYDNIDSLKAQVDAQQEYNSNLGLSKEALIELAATKLEDAAAGKERNAQMLEEIGLEAQQIELLRTQAEELRNLAKLKREGGEKEAAIEREDKLAEQAERAFEKLQSESKKFNDDLYEGLSDSLFRGFEAGKGFFQSFWDGIKNLFKTTVLKLAVQGVMTSVLGLGVAGQAGAATNSAAGIFNSVAQGKSLWDSFSTAAGAAGMSGSIGAGIAGFGNLIGSSSISAFGSGMGLSTAAAGQAASAYSAAGMASTGSAINAGASVANAMPYVAAAIAAFQGAKAINGEYRIGGLSADMGALLGIAPRLFGMAEKKFAGQTVTGMLGTDSLMRNQPWTQSGGLFRSDRSDVWSYGLKDSVATTRDGKSYTDTASLNSDKELLKLLNGSYDAVKAAATDFAKALGLNADAIVKRNDSLNLALGKTQEETEKALADVFAGIADAIAADLIPGIKSLQKEGETSAAAMARLATGLVSVNGVISALGFEKFATGIDGAGSAQRLVDLSGGFEKFTNGAAFFAENFLSEAEKIKPAADSVAETMSRLGKSSVDTVPEFKDLVQSLDLSTESGAKMYAELMAIAPQFKSVAEYTASLNGQLATTGEAIKQAADIARERAQLESELVGLTETSTESLTRQRAALDESNRGIFDQIQAVKERQSVEQQFAAIQKASSDERLVLLGELNQLTITNEERLRAQRFALDQTNVAIFDQIQAVKALKQAEEEATQRAAAIAQERATLQGQLNRLSDSAADALLRHRNALDESNRGIFDQIQAVAAQKQAEQAAAQKATAVAQERASLQDQLNDLSDNAVDALARHRAALDESNRGIFDQIQAVAAQKQAEQAAAQKAAAVAQERATLQSQLNGLTESGVEALARHRAALDESNRAIFDQIQAVTAQKQAEEAAAQRTAAIAQERASLQDQLNGLTESGVEVLARHRAALDESNRAIFDQIQAVTAQKQAEEAATQRAAAIAQERASLQDQLNGLTDSSVEALARHRAALDESNRAIFDQIQAVTAQKQAQEAATQRTAAIAQERASLQEQLNGLTDSGVEALARHRAALDESNRAIFDQIQAVTAQKQVQEASTQRAAAVAQERASLQDQLNGLTESGVEALARHRAALDESNRAIFDQIQAVTAQKQVQEAATQRAAAVAQERASLQDQLNGLTESGVEALARHRAALDESNRAIFDQIQAVTAQKQAQEAATQRTAAIAQERASLQDQLNGLTESGVEVLARHRAALDESNRAIFDQIQAVTAQKQAEEAATQRTVAIAQERASLQDQLNGLTDTGVEALARHRAALDESNRAIFDQIQAVTAQKQAEEAATQRTAAIAQERASLQDQLNGLTDSGVAALARHRAALDESNRAIFDQIQAVTAQKQAEEAATQRAAAIAQERASLQDQLNGLTDSSVEALARHRAALDESNRAIFDQIQAVTAQKQAEEAATQRTAAIAQERASLQEQLNGLTDSGVEALARHRAALDESNRAIFDQIQAVTAQKQVQEAATQRAAAVAQERASLQDQLNGLTESGVEALARHRAALDESNRAIFDQIQAVTAQKQVQEAATQRAAAVAQERASLQDQLNGLTDSSVEALAHHRAALDESNRAIFDQIQAVTAQKQAEEAATQRAVAIAQERASLQDQLNSLTDTSSEALARQRAALDESNRGIFDQIQAISLQQKATEAAKRAADDALGVVQKSIALEKNRISAIRDAAQESIESISGVFTLLSDQLQQVYNSVESTRMMQSRAATEFIDNALLNAKATGYLPDQDNLAQAIASVRGNMASTEYSSKFEADKAALVMAGKLSQLQELAGPQLTAAQQALQIANQQLDVLDAQQQLAQEQVDAINGVNINVLSVSDALIALSLVLEGRGTTVTPQQTIQASQIALYEVPPPSVNQQSDLERLVVGLTQEVQRLQEIVAIGNQYQRRTADAVNGNPEAPMLVELA